MVKSLMTCLAVLIEYQHRQTEMLQRPATSTLELCATWAVYWLTTSPRQSRAASLLPGWTTAMHCWVAHRRRVLTNYSAPRTTRPESSARAGVATTPGRCFTRYTGFRRGSGSPIKRRLYRLTRCGPQPLQRISASWYRPMHHLGLCTLPMLVFPRIHTEVAHRAFSVAAPSTSNSLPADIRLRKHSHIQMPFENPSTQTDLVLRCCIKRICIFGPKGAIQIRYHSIAQ